MIKEISEIQILNKGNQNVSYHQIYQRKIPRWDKLYQLDKKKRETLKLKEQKKKEEINKKEIKECTFKPLINNNSEYIKKNYYSNNLDSNSEKVLKFFSRQKFWNKKKNEKMEDLTKGEEIKELSECKFIPKIVRI